MIKLFIESGIRIRRDDLPRMVQKEIVARTTYTDPVYIKRRKLQQPTEGLSLKIRTHSLDRDYLWVWRGALGKVVRILKSHALKFEIMDQRLWLPKVELTCKVKLRDYQVEPVKTMIRRHQTIGRGPAGSGKTEMMLAAISHFQQPALVLVWQESQQRTWLERIPKYFDTEAGGIGGAFSITGPRYRPITVGLVQSVRNRLEDVKYRFGTVICDEVSRFAAPTLREVVNALPAAVRLGASDDERRADEREFLLYDTFGPRGWRLPEGSGQCDVEVLVWPTDFLYEGDDYFWPDLIKQMVNSRSRNRIIVDLACAEAEAGHRVLIWSDRTEHCRLLKRAITERGYRAGLLLGGIPNKKEAKRTEQGLQQGTVDVGIGTSVAEQSINIPPLDRGIMTCASADRKLYRFKQMRGRLARPFEGKESRLYYLWDQRVPVLKRKLSPLKRRYGAKMLCLTKEIVMPEQVAVTVETLTRGCKDLGIKIPKGATQRTLEKLIRQVLSKDKTYGSYSCGACRRDIIDKLKVCPFCQSKFRFAGEEEPEEDFEEEMEEDEVEEPEEEEADEEESEEEPEEDEEEPEEDEEEPEEEEADEEEDDFEEDEEEDEEEPDEDEEEPEDEEDEGFDEDVEEDEFEEEEEPEPPKRRKKAATAKKAAPRGAKAAAKRKAIADTDKEARREEIRNSLPYTRTQLEAMKRTTLVMVASILGFKNPIKLGTAERMVEAILKAQAKKFPSKTAPAKKTKKATPTKKKATTRRKARR